MYYEIIHLLSMLKRHAVRKRSRTGLKECNLRKARNIIMPCRRRHVSLLVLAPLPIAGAQWLSETAQALESYSFLLSNDVIEAELAPGALAPPRHSAG